MSFFHPPAGFPPHLAIIWPLIWAQVLLLRVAIRRAYGRGVQYHWGVTPNGRVYLASIDYIPGQDIAQQALLHARPANDRLAAACDGRAFIPAYTGLNPLSLGRGAGLRGKGVSAYAVLAAAISPRTPTPLPKERGLPLPEI
ncbi:hypothetical protein HY29_15975 [Hyphomonas beringensis]|uniref:Uncharacterized protein n=1 Tax=Hyphomonas beringensis TaxID=1280946 RepID=A0A062U7Q5_9PROT|nr:hypothetical protein HY29_15975 [Hyphomonas beringensis]